jgi:hypothetical protein
MWCHVLCGQIFLEETSLVARPAVSFPDLKERLEARMKWLGIKVGVAGHCQWAKRLGGRFTLDCKLDALWWPLLSG